MNGFSLPTAPRDENDPGFCKPSKRHRLSNFGDFWDFRSRNRQRRPRARTHNTPNTTRHDITAQLSNLEHSPDQTDTYPCFLFKDELKLFVIFASIQDIVVERAPDNTERPHNTLKLRSPQLSNSKSNGKKKKKIKPRPCIALAGCSGASRKQFIGSQHCCFVYLFFFATSNLENYSPLLNILNLV